MGVGLGYLSIDSHEFLAVVVVVCIFDWLFLTGFTLWSSKIIVHKLVVVHRDLTNKYICLSVRSACMSVDVDACVHHSYLFSIISNKKFILKTYLKLNSLFQEELEENDRSLRRSTKNWFRSDRCSAIKRGQRINIVILIEAADVPLKRRWAVYSVCVSFVCAQKDLVLIELLVK